ncbi:MAG: alpha-L-rhamnosidase N-terminal domain-containing protein [Prevotella sp.]|nr:alpha-L-rhamnosidase N-terminal domain-containing protein [Prevotella sp.]
MKPFLLICWLMTWVWGCRAQTFDTPWISAPVSDSTSHLWFRQTYLPQGRAEDACITVVTTGYFKLYVNEYNVGTALYYPVREVGSDRPIATTFDVTPFLRPDTNVVAILFSPSYPHVDNRQVALSFYGHEQNGKPFSYKSDGEWLCRQANSRLKTDGGEWIDGRLHTTLWKAPSFDTALWVNVEEHKERGWGLLPVNPCDYLIRGIMKRRNYRYFDTTANGVEYEFGQGFIGWVRLTLRNARRGERIRFDNTDYVCNGELDEQACPKFVISPHRRVTITGDSYFSREQITDIEAVETADLMLVNYNY